MKVVEPLLIAVESHKPDDNTFDGKWISMLPFHLQVDELAQKIVEQSKVEPFDRDLARTVAIASTGSRLTTAKRDP